jgi:Cu(I)/Ag(I) efflux system periplasmic protein CusF
LNKHRTKLSFLVALLLCVGLSAACKSTPKAPVIHQGTGVIEEINETAAQVQINHEEIKDYMPAMSMPYRVKDKAILTTVKQGDTVEFTMEDSSAGIFITELKKKEK